MSSLAQDEIGHAAALYGLLAELTGTDADAIAYDRQPAEYRHARLLDHGRGDWAMTIARRFLYETADAVRLEALTGGSWAPARRPRRQARPRGALPPDARRHLAVPAGRGPAARRRSGCAPPSRRWHRMRPRSSRHSPGSRHWSRRASWRRRCASSRRRGERPSPRPSAASTCPSPPRGPAAGGRPRRPRRRLRLALGRVHDGPRERPGGDLVSEGGDPRRGRTGAGRDGHRVGVSRPTAGRTRRPSSRPSPRSWTPSCRWSRSSTSGWSATSRSTRPRSASSCCPRSSAARRSS